MRKTIRIALESVRTNGINPFLRIGRVSRAILYTLYPFGLAAHRVGTARGGATHQVTASPHVGFHGVAESFVTRGASNLRSAFAAERLFVKAQHERAKCLSASFTLDVVFDLTAFVTFLDDDIAEPLNRFRNERPR